jgi:hypothetical protein
MSLRVAALAFGILLTAHTAVALPITFTLSSSLLPSLPGTSVTFTGTVTELGASTFLNGDSFTSALPLDDTPFFLNFPPILTASRTASIFTVSVPLATAPGLYSGTFSILGGTSATTFNVLATQTFAVNVQAVPEPATGSLLLLAAVAARSVWRAQTQRQAKE